VTRVSNGKDWNYTIGLAPKGGSLLEIGDVIYIDQPVGTGFSYGKNDSDVLTSMDDVVQEFANFMDSFLHMYPEYQQRKIILMGESVAGKYLPRFTKALKDYIQQGGPANLQALVIGNPF
jgi:carboxypeptidase D